MSKRRVGLLAVSGLLGASVGILGAGAPAGAAVTCTGLISNQTIFESIVVPEGELCELYNVEVLGSVTVKKNAGLRVASGSAVSGDPSHIRGSIDVKKGAIYLTDSTVDASVNLREVRPFQTLGTNEQLQYAGLVCGNDIGGTVRVLDTSGSKGGPVVVGGDTCFHRFQDAYGSHGSGNHIAGSLLVKRNRQLVTIDDNFVAGSVECTDNNPDPDYGSNTVLGSVSGECP